jgi:hypothetical protein
MCGEAGESQAALTILADRAQWQNHLVVRALRREFRRWILPERNPVQPSARHNIPPCITAALPDVFT